jgi:hypothetical protein
METVKTNLPKWKCHKVVEAARIALIGTATPGGSRIVPLILVLPDGSSVEQQVTADYIAKHKPEAGGYFVRYDDSYASYSPAGAFESGYRLDIGDKLVAKEERKMFYVLTEALGRLDDDRVGSVMVYIGKEPGDGRIALRADSQEYAELATENVMLDIALKGKNSENARLRLRVGQLEEALRMAGVGHGK